MKNLPNRCENDFSILVYQELYSQIDNTHVQSLKVWFYFHISYDSEWKYYSYHSIVQRLEFILDAFFSISHLFYWSLFIYQNILDLMISFISIKGYFAL